MADYCLTAHSSGLGWRDIQVLNAGDMHEAITAAEKVTGCKVSHGRSGVQSLFDPGTVIDLITGEVTQRHDRTASASTEIVMAPPEVLRAIRLAMQQQQAGARADD